MNLIKNSKLLIVLLSVLLCVGCGSDTKNEVENPKYTEPKLKEVTCDNLDYHYGMCDRYSFLSHVESCRGKYTPKLFQCYGAKAAGF